MSRRLLPTLLVCLTPVLAACGGGGGGDAGADPAEAVPAAAPAYLELAARPEGDVRADAEAALRKVLRTDDPSRRATELFDDAAGDSGLRWKDVERWLGDRVGVGITAISGSSPDTAVVAAVRDEDAAREALRRLARAKGARPAERKYRDTTYELDAGDDTATGLVGGYAVIASERAFKAVVDTVDGRPALAGAKDFEEATDAAGAGDALGFAYVDTGGLADALSKGTSLGGAEVFLRQALARAGRSAVATLTADGERIRVGTLALGAKPTAGSDRGAKVLAGLPGDAWLAAGLADLGGSGRRALDGVESLGSLGPVDVGDALKALERGLGLDIRRDLLSWMGDAGLYARGRALSDVGVALTVETTDRRRSNAAVGRIGRALSRVGAQVEESAVDGYDRALELRFPALPLPIPFYLAANDERVSFGVNPDALTAIADPGDRLGDNDRHATAGKLLGDRIAPSFLLDLPTVVELVEGLGLGDRGGYDRIKPYLDALGALAAGSRHEADAARGAFVIGLR